ncbi:SCO-spondin-like [Dreissena polymorpha]|uniref:SCO-spondin-like n=1 Tax=Dreissena polymorpha TaxID=45954 RepID=UPI002263F6FD|nr:SCO-spondin-like [Dreissena polymorpha]
MRECDSGVPCGVPGNWTPWSVWTPCSATCGTGVRGRSRTCTNPEPQYGGPFCEGPAYDKGECDTGIPCPIPGNWSPWSDFGKCDVSCGTGYQFRTRSCTNPPPQFGGSDCLGENKNGLQCDTGIMCPIPGGWSPWTPFTACDASCGIGMKIRTRSCTDPVPQYGGSICAGPDSEAVKCTSEKQCPQNGAWSIWYEWTPCQAKCGLGLRKRHRECSNPKPMYGGMQCDGMILEISECDSGIHCPIHGGWTSWYAPTPCSASCGLGTQTKVRECTNPPPQYDGSFCVGPDKDTIKCDTGVPCPIHGNWSPWSVFEPCNVKCGVGIHTRVRLCSNPMPQFGGMNCEGPNIQEAKCDTKTVCPIHGGWSMWSPWSKCKTGCGIGQQLRVRSCDNPNPLFGGFVCQGPDSEVKDCDSKIHCPIPGAWTEWSPWDNCTAVCGSGMQNRFRECSAPLPQYGGPDCTGPPIESRECVTGIPCPVDGSWSLWSLWTTCSVHCGMGVRMRERFCDSPSPQFDGRLCEGISMENDQCDTGMFCPVSGAWSHWTSWSDCSAACDVGSQIRKRFCTNPTPMYGGLACAGQSEETRLCDTGLSCPLHGHWGEWSVWTRCSVECGIGVQSRVRVCDNPTPKFGGAPCKGFAEEVIHCDTNTPCPVHGNWSPWSNHNECSVSCGMGFHIRQRICYNPPPQYGGLQCEGPAEEKTGCDTGLFCPVNGNWGPWYGVTECLGKCGLGEMDRRRECNNPHPQHGGLPCKGPEFDVTKCDTKIPCPVDGHWGPWSSYKQCNAMCGVGLQERVRQCNDPPPQFGGKSCTGADHEALACDTGIICQINGNWGQWSGWGQCSVSCGVGIQSKDRLCDSPPPQFGGFYCEGPSIEERKCESSVMCLQPGGWTSWSSWTVCSATCGLGSTNRYRNCDKPPPLYGGLLCIGLATENKECDSGAPCPVHGNWGHWYGWSECSVHCGIGFRERKRVCDNPLPHFGGMPCKGKVTEVEGCDTLVPCQVDGGWTPWSSWTGCSATCGIGMQDRSRICENPRPAFGGLPCQGPADEITDCDTTRPCPINGGWSPWSTFSSCSVNCGIGHRKRVRLCNSPPPHFGGDYCYGSDLEIVACDSGHHCPVDGGWTFWSEWSRCDAKCGKGISERLRRCTNPSPMYEGKSCNGAHLEIIDCDSGIPCSMNGNWSPWSEWDKCSAACGIGKQIRFRTCSNPRPSLGGMICIGMPEETRDCNSGKPCSQNGNWAHWSDWSLCDAHCGKGNQLRYRTCTNPKPMYGGLVCFGHPEEKRTCDSGVTCAIPGGWSFWSDWDVCSVRCGRGFQVRVRTCTNPVPQFGGPPCEGWTEEKRSCDGGQYCVIDGEWGEWMQWESCNVKCDVGIRRRFRQCDSPSPQNGGKPCYGYEAEENDCNTGVSCEHIGMWSLWGGWDHCSVSCGDGVQGEMKKCGCALRISRARCTVGGLYGRRTQSASPTAPKRDASNVSLFIEWSAWTKWTQCSAKCGAGEQERSRVCVEGAVDRSTTGCVGDSRDIVLCKTLSCPTWPLNCSTECKWDNGIGYVGYPGDCSMFVQCDSLNGTPQVQDCSWGLLWSMDLLQCVYPAQSECDVCAGAVGHFKPYHISCRAYWDCTHVVPAPRCCASHERFNPFTNSCEADPKGICHDSCNTQQTVVLPSVCEFRESTLGANIYEQEISGAWLPRPCGDGTIFSQKDCGCIYFYDGLHVRPKECVPDLHLNFDSLKADLDRNIGLHVQNVTYLGDGTAYFDGSAAINDNIFANSEWGKDVYIYIRFKPEGNGRNQGLVHNSGCGPSDIGPSVFVGMDREPRADGPDNINMKFATVPRKGVLEYDFVNVTAPGNEIISAWFKFGKGHFEAEVNGVTVQLNIPGANEIARRHGAINIGGNLCNIGNEAFVGFVGILDEVRIYKCKPSDFIEHFNQKPTQIPLIRKHG